MQNNLGSKMSQEWIIFTLKDCAAQQYIRRSKAYLKMMLATEISNGLFHRKPFYLNEALFIFFPRLLSGII